MVEDHQNIKTDQELGFENPLKYPVWIRQIFFHEIFVISRHVISGFENAETDEKSDVQD